MSQINYPNPKIRSFVSTNTELQLLAQLNDLTPIVNEVNSQDTRITALEDAPASGSRLIASLTNVNLQTISFNVLDWIGTNTAANTRNPTLVVNWVSGVYVDDTTDISLTLNNITLLVPSGSVTGTLSNLDSTKMVSAPMTDGGGYALFSNSGNWALPVAQGTLNSFIVNIYIFGDTI